MNENLINHIEEYLNNNSTKTDFIDLFESHDNKVESSLNNILLRTDLSFEELVLVNIIILNSKLMSSRGCDFNIFDRFINQYLRLKVSKDRLSRREFVDINKRERFDDNLNKFNSFQNLKKVKE